MTTPRRRSVLVALIGQGVTPSLTPPMHEREGARHGLNYVYRTVDISPDRATQAWLREMLDAARAFGFDGLNVTHPIKQAIVPLLDELSPDAERVGAVNTIRFADGRAVGHNTDVTGFGSAFDAAFGRTAHDRVVVVGAGGAGSAVAAALERRPIRELVVVDADEGRARRVVDGLDVRGGSARPAAVAELPELLASASGVVNATPLGMADHPGAAFDPGLLPRTSWVADIVYRPTTTALLAAARTRGLTTMSGLGMAMGQAADAFEIFTGERADRAAMTRDLQDLVAAEATAPA